MSMRQGSTEKTAGLYVHIPFCARKCGYCDFVSYTNRGDIINDYCDALSREMHMHQKQTIDSIFIGGGTPSLLHPRNIQSIISSARARHDISDDCEITMECNPGTVEQASLAGYIAAGVNRLSFGAQAACDGMLARIGRLHRVRDIYQAVKFARSAGCENINIDLMYGLPGQKITDWEKSLEMALDLGCEHVSAYSLIIEENTPAAGWINELPGEDEICDMEDMTEFILHRNNLERYEISNYAAAGYRCRHNLHYWNYDDFIGIGCAAHGMENREIIENTSDLDDYMRRVSSCTGPAVTKRKMSHDEGMFLFLMMGLRLIDGIKCAEFARRFGILPHQRWSGVIQSLIDDGLAQYDGVCFKLTPRGLDIQNIVLEKFI